jgi:uncharacterized membrane protein
MRATTAHPASRRDDRGLVVTELAIVAPALLAMLVLAMFGARVTWSERQVQSASAAAARAAAQQGTIGRAEQVADEVVGDNLQDAGLGCSGGPSVSTTPGPDGFGPGGSVMVEVRCVTSVSDLVFVSAPGSYPFEHTSTEVIDTLRGTG